jgi:hypothetical protein
MAKASEMGTKPLDERAWSSPRCRETRDSAQRAAHYDIASGVTSFYAFPVDAAAQS